MVDVTLARLAGVTLYRIVSVGTERAELTRRRRVGIHVCRAWWTRDAVHCLAGVLSYWAKLTRRIRVAIGVSVPRLALPAARGSDAGHPMPNFNAAVLTGSRRVGVEICESNRAVDALCRAAARALAW